MKINEIFTSIDGEVNYYGQGTITTFIRLQGCNLSCSYCDTKQALDPGKGEEIDPRTIAGQIETSKVTITGGEPLLQKNELIKLLTQLQNKRVNITIETNGSILIPSWYNVKWIVDYKLHYAPNQEFNFLLLGPDDFVKILIGSRNDYIEAKKVYFYLRKINCLAQVAFSPINDHPYLCKLLECLIEDKLYDVKLNIQLHKLIGVK